MKKALLIYSLTLFVGSFTCCHVSQEKKDEIAADSIFETVEEKIAPFPNLQIGEVFLKDKDPFTEIIELKGKPYLPDTTIYRVREARMDIVRDKLVLQEQPFIGETAMFRLLNYPDLTYIRSTGNRGNGPGELFSAVFVPSYNTDILGYIYDTTRNKLYKLTEQGNLEEDPFVFRKGKSVFGTIGEMVNIGADDFLYIDDSQTGRSIMRATKDRDSIEVNELVSLQLNPKRKSPFTYIGYFGVNKAKNRMVYAYKYFKVLKFIDMETLQVRTLNFQQTEFDQSTLGVADGLDNNVTHYWGISPENDYVYCIYSGRKPVEVMAEARDGLNYIFIEQFDWNGNPIAKYKLDQWGYFTVDEKNNKLILMSTRHDDPFFIYDLPSNKASGGSDL